MRQQPYTVFRDGVDSRYLKGWKTYVWIFWGDRTYARNRWDDEFTRVNYFFLLFMAGAACLFYHYFPLAYFGMIVLISANTLVLFRPIFDANKTPLPGLVNLMIGITGTIASLNLGLTLFGWHFEFILFDAYLIGGALACYRRCWNCFIWAVIDRIIRSYFKPKKNRKKA